MESKSRVEELEWAGRLGFWGFHELPTGMPVWWNAGLGPRCCRSLLGIERGLIKSSLLIVCLWRIHSSYDRALQ